MGFCLFGVIGFCKQESTSISIAKQQITKAQEIIQEKINRVMVDIKANSVQLNEIVVDCKKDCIIENVTMDQVAEINLKGQASLQNVLTSSVIINDVIDSAAKIAKDIQNRNTGSARSTYSSAEQDAIVSMKTQLTQRTTQETFASCVASVIQTNSIRVRAEGNAIVNGIIMKQVSKVLSDCVINIFQGLVSKVQNDSRISQRLEEESKIRDEGLFDFNYLIIGGVAVVLIAVIIMMRKN